MKCFRLTSTSFTGLVCIILLCFIPTIAQSQSLELYNVNSKKTKSIMSMNDVTIYTRHAHMEKIKGRLQLLNDSTILINSIQLPINEVTAIKVITQTSQMWGYIFAGISALYLSIGIITLSNASGAGFIGNIFLEIIGTLSVMVGVGALVPAIRFLFFGKTYRKNAGWVLQVPGP